MTDIPRLRAGGVGGQFWSVWVPVNIKGPEAVQTTIEQIDLVKRIAARYPADLEMALTAADVRRIHHSGKIACMIGIEGGNQVNNSLAVLRQMYDLGARYMTLTHVLEHRLGRFRNRCASSSRPDPLRRRGGPGDESSRHARRLEPCVPGNDASRLVGQRRSRSSSPIPPREPLSITRAMSRTTSWRSSPKMVAW